jgi:hypothetical protein
MAKWRVAYMGEGGDPAVQDVVAGEKWTQDGLVSFVNREVVGETMRVVVVWEIEENLISNVEVVAS